MDFPPTFVHWISLCVSSPSFSVQINGELAGYFGSSRGLRQGCPLSPYLFVLCMNVLSNLLDEAVKTGKFDYHPKCKNIHLTHLCFADDLLVFSDGKQKSIEGVLKTFEEFRDISGLQVSLEKSSIFSAGINPTVLQHIKDIYKISTGQLPVRYLGLPLLTKRMASQDYTPLVERIRSKLMSWTGRFLSYAGRLQLVKSVIVSLINFWVSAFRLPNQCITKINGLCAAFLWSGPELNVKKSKMSWEAICKPFKEGGLGIRSIKDTNKVSSLKLIWRLLSVTTPWSRWVKTYLMRKESFWSLSSSSTNGSWIWRKLLKLKQEALQLHRMDIGDGATSSFWYDYWSPLGRFILMTGDQGPRLLGIQQHATVLEASTTRARRYRSDLLQRVMDTAHATFNKLQPSKQDKHKWKHKADGFNDQFISTNTWNIIRQRSQTTTWSKGIWFTSSTPKYSFLSWLAINNRLSTGDRISSWSNGSNMQCSFCGWTQETRDHLFFLCSYSSRIWKTIFGNLIPNGFSNSWNTVIDLISKGTSSPITTFLIRYAFQSTLYHLWRERNSRRHGQQPSTGNLITKLIDKNIRNQICSLPSKECDLYKLGLLEWFSTR